MVWRLDWPALRQKKLQAGISGIIFLLCWGMQTLAAMVAATLPGEGFGLQSWAFALAATSVCVSYVGSALWMLERHRAGNIALWITSLLSLAGAWVTLPHTGAGIEWWLWKLQPIVSGLMLGLPLAAMLLGHWYLNWPGMQLAPLRRLILGMGVVAIVGTLLSGFAFANFWAGSPTMGMNMIAFLALRWLFGLVGILALTWMAYQTLKIPNTQSATGILYVAVIGSFVGELAALLLPNLMQAAAVMPL